ncbi:hypothetical protein BDV33DRAFT_172839 [Aspergillus novoparasiticus]|uniref:Uncharacterized protein n=1 Tax=Aspergillus novoparasiticus TaxID=986946 RepID=A0A5N6ESV2_9EURO|nr:hypothetical protein BDV33DRAFT_172839 [Aspergillus novoparasiticus]
MRDRRADNRAACSRRRWRSFAASRAVLWVSGSGSRVGIGLLFGWGVGVVYCCFGCV